MEQKCGTLVLPTQFCCELRYTGVRLMPSSGFVPVRAGEHASAAVLSDCPGDRLGSPSMRSRSDMKDDGMFDTARTMGALSARGYSWRLSTSKVRRRLGLPEHVLVIDDGTRKRVFRGRKLGDVYWDATRLVERRRPTARETRWVDRTVPAHRHPGWEPDPNKPSWSGLFKMVLFVAHCRWHRLRQDLRVWFGRATDDDRRWIEMDLRGREFHANETGRPDD